MPRPWSEDEVRFLIKHAGRDTVTDIASALSRTRHDVRREAAIRGINAVAPRSRLVTCPRCGRGRTRLSRYRDICRVCALDEAVAAIDAKIDAEIASSWSPVEMRARFGPFRGIRGIPSTPPRMPRRPSTRGMTPAQAVRAEDAWLASCESVELAAAVRRHDAARKQLQRVRAAIAEEGRDG